MDPLALLCNLHADGPATLQRLRRSGCESLGALLKCDVPDLVRRLDWVSKRAERFLREAQHLAGRLGGGLLEPEGAAELEVRPPIVPAVSPPAAPPGVPATSPLEDGPSAETDVGPAPEPRAAWSDGDDDEEDFEEGEEGDELADGDSVWTLDEDYDGDDDAYDDGEGDEYEDELPAVAAPTVERVVSAWRALDRSQPPTGATEFVPPRPAPRPGGDVSLARVSLDGLTPALGARLAGLGIGTVQALVEAPTLETSRRLSLGYTRLSRLQFLARRRLEEGTDPGRHDRRALARSVKPGVRAYVTPPGPRRGEPERRGERPESLESSGPFA